MKKLITLTLLLAMTACTGGHPAYATMKLVTHPPLPIFNNGGVHMKCAGIENLSSMLKAFDDDGFRTLEFDHDQTQALLKAFNAQEPVTAMKADKLYAARWSGGVFGLITLGNRECLTMKPITNEDFDALVKTALGIDT